MGIVSLLAGIILRTPAFSQVERIQRMLMDQTEMLVQFAAFWGNPNTTPRAALSGWRSGHGPASNDPMRPAQMSKDDQFTLESLEDGHPLRSQWNALRDFTYYSNPAISHWMGSELKETTWLGRDVRRPDGFSVVNGPLVSLACGSSTRATIWLRPRWRTWACSTHR